MTATYSPTFLVPLDGSKLARAALDELLPLARSTGGAVTLVSVMEPVMDRYFEQFAAAEDISISEAIMTYLEGEATALAHDLELPVDHHLLSGFGEKPGHAIAKYAADRGFDMIAMSTRGLSGLKRLILGSVAKQVTEATTVPVLLFPVH